MEEGREINESEKWQDGTDGTDIFKKWRELKKNEQVHLELSLTYFRTRQSVGSEVFISKSYIHLKIQAIFTLVARKS